MKNLIDDVKRHTHRGISGYYYLKTQKVYIPFMKITIECLTRKITDLNIFFESILKLIEISVKDVNEISMILGVSYDVIKEAIIDMVNINYVFVSNNILGLTAKGKEALKSKKKIEIKKTYLKDILVDMITGEILDSEGIRLIEPKSRTVCLEESFKIDSDFLSTHFKEINDVYQLQQKNNSVFGDSAIVNELYKIIGVTYSSLYYTDNDVYMYKSETSDELIFEFKSDINDKYKNELYKQLKDDHRPCQEHFFERRRDFTEKLMLSPLSQEIELMVQANETKKALFSDQTDINNKIYAFKKKRYALNDQEYVSYLYNSKELDIKRIFICSNNLNDLLSSSFSSQLNVLSTEMPVFIIFDKNEYKVDNSIKHFFSNPNKNLYIIPFDSIEENIICFDSELTIHFHFGIIDAFNKKISYKLPIFDFDRNQTKEKVEHIIEKYELQSKLPYIISKKSKKKH